MRARSRSGRRSSRSYNKEPYYIRRQLTEGAVRAADKRAQFVGVDAYEAAGGVVMRDLFEHDDGGWLQDPALLDRLVDREAQAEAETLRAEGWKWIEVAADFPYGHTAGLRRLTGETVDLTDEEQASLRRAAAPSSTALEEEYAEADELPDEVDQRLGEIETAIAALRGSARQLRSGRDRPRRRLRQHRRRGRVARRARLCPARGRGAG